FLDQITNLNSVYRKRHVFQLVVLGFVLVFMYRLYIPFENSGYIMTMATLIGTVLWFIIKNYTNKKVDMNETIQYRLENIQSRMYSYVDTRMRRISTSDSNNLSRKIYSENLSRMRLDYLYMDVALINFLYDLLFLYKYNNDSFASMVIGVNGILSIRNELEEYYNSNGHLPDTVTSSVDSAKELMTKTLNYTHTFVYSLPKSLDSGLTSSIISKMHKLLKVHVVVIKKFAVRKNVQEGINKRTRFTEMRDHLPEARDTSVDDHFELYI
ncbi:hypothetical protein SAGO17_0050, partial [Mimivirus AB-566-O17]